MKVKELIAGQEVVTAQTDTKLGELARIMRERDISGVPIVDEWGALAGLVTASDLLRKASPPHAGPGSLDLPADAAWSPAQHTHEHDPDWKKLEASEVMVSDLCTVGFEDDVQLAARALINRSVHRAIVLGEDRNVHGIVSALDFAALVAEGKLVG